MDDRSYNHSRPTNPGVPNLVDDQDSIRLPNLTLLRGGLPGRMFRIDRDGIVLGRQPNCDIQLDEGGVSRRHAVLHLGRGDAVEIIDCKSTNGTFVNGHRVDRARLRDGDKVQLGSFVVLRFNYQDALDEAFQRQQFDSITRDSLTGCHNRLYFDEALRRELAYTNRKGGELAVALVDLDHFKLVNDGFGHSMGDTVLQQVALALYGQLRNYDVLARYGGEEFAVLLRGATIEDGRSICERLRAAVQSLSVGTDAHAVRPTVSVGVAHVSERPNDGRGMMRVADQRLYAAKAAGRNQVAYGQLSGQLEGEQTAPVDTGLARQAIEVQRRKSADEQAALPVAPPAIAPPVAVKKAGRKVPSLAATRVDSALEPLELDGFVADEELDLAGVVADEMIAAGPPTIRDLDPTDL